MNASEIMIKLPEWISALSLILTSLTILATVIVRLTPSKLDDEAVSGFAASLNKLLNSLPTFGINPRTKKLQEAYEELKEEKKSE